jgi:hypothetical protein
MDGGVTSETHWCQAKSRRLPETKAHLGVQVSFARLADIAVSYWF